MIVGHTHADVDALIGTIVSYLRNVDQMSPEEFSEAVGEACKSADGAIDGIENTLATPDYESYFGARKMKEIRMMASDTDDDCVIMHYKVNITYISNVVHIKFLWLTTTGR